MIGAPASFNRTKRFDIHLMMARLFPGRATIGEATAV
jgi:hypothetical protein